MYGWVNASLEEYIIQSFGQESWRTILKGTSHFANGGEFILGVHYEDDLTSEIVSSAAETLQMTPNDILRGFGGHFVKFLEEKGFGNLLAGQARTLREWIQNIDEPHRLLRGRFPEGNLPEFRTEEDSNYPIGPSLLLHYYSTRPGGFGPVVVGVVTTVAKRFFDSEICMDCILEETINESTFVHHSVWRIRNIGESINTFPLNNKCVRQSTNTLRCPFQTAQIDNNNLNNTSVNPNGSGGRPVPIGASTFKKIFPFHIVVDKTMHIIQIGNKLSEMLDALDLPALDQPIQSLFSLDTIESSPWNWSLLSKLQNNTISIRCISPNVPRNWTFTGEIVLLDDDEEEEDGEDNAVAALLVNPNVKSIQELLSLNIAMADLPRHSFQRDLLHMGDEFVSELAHSARVIEMSSRLENESKRSRDALQMKRIFVRYVSHEVRTPLNVASLGLKYVDQLLFENQQSQANEEEQQEHLRDVLDDIQDSCGLAVDILNDLLLYEKIDDGIFTISPVPMIVQRILTEAEKLFLLLSKGSRVAFRFDLEHLSDPPESLVVGIDRSKFHQVLRNLFTNAIKFTPPQGVISIRLETFESMFEAEDGHITFGQQVKVSPTSPDYHPDNSQSGKKEKETQERSIGGEIDGPFLRISVTDDGCGIGPEHQVRLFHEFIQVQADKLQNGHGSGLGLWICMNIMHMHNGRIGVHSMGEGSGTTFVLDLPLLSAPHALPLEGSQSWPNTPSMQQLGHNAQYSPSQLAALGFFKTDVPLANGHSITKIQSTDGDTLYATQPASQTIPAVSPSSHQHHTPSQTYHILSPTARRGKTHQSLTHQQSLTQQSLTQQQAMHRSPRLSQTATDSPNPRPSRMSLNPQLHVHILTPEPHHPWSASSLSSLPSPLQTSIIPKTRNRQQTTTTAVKNFLSPERIVVTCPHLEMDEQQDDKEDPFLARCRTTRVLVVDDAALNRKMVRRLLQRQFQVIEEAEDGAQAVDMYTSSSSGFDVVLMDYMMPVMNGLDATRALLRVNPAAVVIGVTGNGQEEDIDAFIQAGAKAVLVKPLKMDGLDMILKNLWRL